MTPVNRPLKVALTQTACTADPAANLAAQLAMLDSAAAQGAQILCTQELFATQYFCQTENHDYFKLAQPIPGPATDAIGRIARKHKAVIIASVFERRAAGLYHNTAAIIETDGSIAGIYRKMHIPDDPLYYEKFYFTPGDTGFRAWNTTYAKIGVLICWDQWFPEAARLTAMQGAEILFYPTAIGWHPAEKQQFGPSQLEAWQIMQRSHAIANGCFVCSPNRIGHEQLAGEGIDFWGHSFIAAPDGRMIAQASADRPQILAADLDLSQVEFSRTHWPFLRDRRIDAYAGLTRRLLDSPQS